MYLLGDFGSRQLTKLVFTDLPLVKFILKYITFRQQLSEVKIKQQNVSKQIYSFTTSYF